MQPPATLGAAPAEKTADKKKESSAACRALSSSVRCFERTRRRTRRADESGQRPRVHPGDIRGQQRRARVDPSLAVLGGLVLDEDPSLSTPLLSLANRIPSVMQTREATRHIAEGQSIIVDGDLGIVELEPESV